MSGGLAIGDPLSGLGEFEYACSDDKVNILLLNQCHLHGVDVQTPVPNGTSEAFNFESYGLPRGAATQPEDMQPRPAPTPQYDGMGM